MKNRTKRYITLIEMMIVMFLIAMITGVVAYNYTSSLERGKAFKTEAGIEKLKTALALEVANGREFQGNLKDFLIDSPLVKNIDELSKDGWGEEYQVTPPADGESEFTISSKNLEAYKRKSRK